MRVPDVAVPKRQATEITTLKETNEKIRQKQGESASESMNMSEKFQELTNACQSEFIERLFGLNRAAEDNIDLQSVKISSFASLSNKKLETILFQGVFFIIVTGNIQTT